MTEQTDAAEVEALAEFLSWAGGDFTQWFDDAHPDHNRWSWRGDGHGSAMREVFYEQARKILASDWLAAHEAAAEVRGAQAVLAAVEAEASSRSAGRLDVLRAARAAAAAAGGGGAA